MADAAITIQWLILHKMDHINSAAPQYADLTSSITPDVHAFFVRQIDESRESKNARSGKFLTLADGQPASAVQGMCDELTMSEDVFIQQSKSLTACLFDRIKGDKRISVSDLVVLTFTEPPDPASWIAILKMDQHSGLVGDIIETNGKTRAVLKPALGVLTNNDVQKCAFILPKDRRTDRRDLVVLDQRRARSGAHRVAVTFFVTKFLQATVGVDPRTMTETFYRESRNWIVDNRTRVSEDEAATLDARVHAALTEVQIDIDALAGATLEAPELQDDYVSYMREKLREQDVDDLVFQPDPTFVPKQRYLTFSGDNGLKIRVFEDAFGPGKTLDYHEDSATGRITVEINTRTLERR